MNEINNPTPVMQHGPEPKHDKPEMIQKKTFSFSKSINAAANKLLIARIAELEQRGVISNAVAKQLYSDRSFISSSSE